MIPYILAVVGGYLLGDSMKESQKFADGGETDDMGVQFIDYKDKTIMFEPHNKEYFTNDIEFKTLAEAKKYIDAGSPDPSWEKFVYSHGIMADGGMVYVGEKKWDNGNLNLNFKSTWRGGNGRSHTTSDERSIIKVGDKFLVKNTHRIPSEMFNGKKFDSIEEAKEAVLNYYNIDRSNGRGKDPDYADGGGVMAKGGKISKEDVLSVAKRINKDLTEKEIDDVLKIYPSVQIEWNSFDPNANWNLVVEECIYKVRPSMANGGSVEDRKAAIVKRRTEINDETNKIAPRGKKMKAADRPKMEALQKEYKDLGREWSRLNGDEEYAKGGPVTDGYVVYFGVFRGRGLTPVITEYHESLADAEKSVEQKKAKKEKGWKIKALDKMPVSSEVRMGRDNANYNKVKGFIHSEEKVTEFFKDKDSFYKKDFFWVKPEGYEWDNWQLKKK